LHSELRDVGKSHAFLDSANLFHGVFETVIKLFKLNVAFAVVMRTKPQTDNLIDAKQDGFVTARFNGDCCNDMDRTMSAKYVSLPAKRAR